MVAGSSHRPRSIERRVLRSAVVTVLVCALIGAAATAIVVSQMVRHLMESALEEAAQVLVVLAEHDQDFHELTRDLVLPAGPHRETLVWQLRSSDGALLARSHDAPKEPWAAPLVEGHLQETGLALFTVAGRGLWLQVAQPLNHLHRAQTIAALQAGGAAFVLGLAAAAIVAWRIRVELRPLGRLAKDVESINPGPVASELPRSTRLELEPVYNALEHLLRRLAEKLRSERAFAAQAAHSLRTPLAGLTAQIEVAKIGAPADLQGRLDQALDAARRLNGVVGGLLALGRAAGPLVWRPFDASELGKLALGGRLEADVSGLDQVPVLHGHLDLISAAVANLVDNSARHGASRVSVTAVIDGRMQQLRLVDNGPRIPPERLQALRDALARFERYGEVTDLLGLGLTLAATVARAHGGRLDVDCTGLHTPGFCVALSWPSMAPDAAGVGQPGPGPGRERRETRG
jgi:signal transduction histidine kinase